MIYYAPNTTVLEGLRSHSGTDDYESNQGQWQRHFDQLILFSKSLVLISSTSTITSITIGVQIINSSIRFIALVALNWSLLRIFQKMTVVLPGATHYRFWVVYREWKSVIDSLLQSHIYTSIHTHKCIHNWNPHSIRRIWFPVMDDTITFTPMSIRYNRTKVVVSPWRYSRILFPKL